MELTKLLHIAYEAPMLHMRFILFTIQCNMSFKIKHTECILMFTDSNKRIMEGNNI